MDEDKAKAEKMAAAKKKFDQMRKAKAKKAGGGGKKGGEAATPAPATEETPSSPATPTATDAPEKEDKEEGQQEQEKPTEAFPSVPEDTTAEPVSTSTTPSLSQQSKARSTSFRQGSVSISSGAPLSPGAGTGLGLFSPEGETAPDIYRKHVLRIEELERENKTLAKDAKDAEKRWQKAEEELADLREGEGESTAAGEGAGEVGKLKSELAALQRQNAQLQAQLTRRHGASPSLSMNAPPATTELEAQLSSKSATIETMELEMSRLRAQVERLSVSASTPSEQITALEEKLARAEQAAGLAQRELHDVKAELEQASKKAVKEGSERASAETKLRTLEQTAAEATAARDELARKADALEKKAATLTTLHREQDGRTQALRREKERAEKEVVEVRGKLERVEAENVRLRKKDAAEGGGDDEGVDELEDEGRLRLERRIRELEAENTELRGGIWREKRREMQVGPDEAAAAAGVGGRFETVDLGGGMGSPPRKGGAGLGDFFTSGLNALTGAAGGGPGHGHGHGHDEGLLEDDDMEFDEEAFRRAQEEEQKKRIERIKEIKRSLKNWEGWRVNLMINMSGPLTLHSSSINRPRDNDNPEERRSAYEEMGSQPWPGYPGQPELDHLESMADLRWFGEDDDLPNSPYNATYEMVLQNAMASVPLLEIIGRDAGAGIDRFGRLCYITRDEENYNGFFCDLVARVQQRLGRKVALRKARAAITEKLQKFLYMVSIDSGQEGKPDRGKWQTLYCVMSHNMVPDLNLSHLHAILSECEPALREVWDFGYLVKSVRRDLDRAITPRAWDRLFRVRESLGLLDERELETAMEEGNDKVFKLLESDWETVEPMSDHIKTLKSDLEAAIKEFHRPWCGLSGNKPRDGAANT
ncbi:hypothetical protein F5144DRAFT_619976 [Chaetomium tenue]|uniref:Uncharacterized protein n=1 Tax=Chaetomium tenue TaxID=1854479 RepID=A0ACB7PEQ7_9PEZI|nr:hypothetical protein F5144DRAFT_619976 [Chaetomium globosum]